MATGEKSSGEVAHTSIFRSLPNTGSSLKESGAIRLWTKMGFETVGTVPGAFNHATEGYVDALIMVRTL